ncbi:MAG TPA: hypothetical protein VLI69_05510 [Gammaproteobacteria bacterium]|nr:hypothetical protein [Gammaproteobacteria bacterium]
MNFILTIEFLQQHLIELLAFIVSFTALIVSWISMYYSNKAFSLSLFDKRYKFYHDFKILVNEMLKFDIKLFPDSLKRTKFLLWEAQYIYGEDVCGLLKKIHDNLCGVILCHQVVDDMAAGNQSEDSEIMSRLMAEHYRPLQSLIADLLGDNDITNLNFYFHNYLADKDFKKPLS